MRNVSQGEGQESSKKAAAKKDLTRSREVLSALSFPSASRGNEEI